jgi:hypothetical protein
MNVFEYLTTVTFLTTQGASLACRIKPHAQTSKNTVLKIDMPYEKYNEQFGNASIPSVGDGALAARYPGLFKDEIACAFFPHTTPDYARYLLALSMMQRHLYHYASPRYDDHGHMLFNEQEGYDKAHAAGKSYVIMEDLS